MTVFIYSFDGLHADAVASGKKTRTIRSIGRRRHPSPGDTVRLFIGLRTPRARLIAQGICTANTHVSLRFYGGALVGGTIGRQRITRPDEFAVLDGFADAKQMGAYFASWHGAGNFEGVMIEWRLE